LDRNFIARHWYADVYEQFENQTNDVEFLLEVLRENTDAPQNGGVEQYSLFFSRRDGRGLGNWI